MVYPAVEALNGHELLYLCFMGAIWAAARLSNCPGVIPAVMVTWELRGEPVGGDFFSGFLGCESRPHLGLCGGIGYDTGLNVTVPPKG